MYLKIFDQATVEDCEVIALNDVQIAVPMLGKIPQLFDRSERKVFGLRFKGKVVVFALQN